MSYVLLEYNARLLSFVKRPAERSLSLSAYVSLYSTRTCEIFQAGSTEFAVARVPKHVKYFIDVIIEMSRRVLIASSYDARTLLATHTCTIPTTVKRRREFTIDNFEDFNGARITRRGRTRVFKLYWPRPDRHDAGRDVTRRDETRTRRGERRD